MRGAHGYFVPSSHDYKVLIGREPFLETSVDRRCLQKMNTATLIDADLGGHGDNSELYAAMSREALNMAHCCDAFLNAAAWFIPIRLEEENVEGNMASRSRSEIFGNGSHWHGDYVLSHKAYVEM